MALALPAASPSITATVPPAAPNPFSVVPVNRANDPAEQNILQMIDAVHVYMLTLTSDYQARMFHASMTRMLAAMSDSAGTYTSATAAADIVTHANTARDDALAIFVKGSNPVAI